MSVMESEPKTWPVARLLRWQDEIPKVAERWKAQYFNGGRWGSTVWGPTETTYRQFAALGPDTTLEDAERIAKGWVTFWCDNCHEYVPVAIQLGDEPDYESATVTLCLPCFDKAAEVRKGATL